MGFFSKTPAADIAPESAPDDPRIHFAVQPRARRISLKMDNARRRIIVNAPSERQMPAARRFARDKADWIAVHLEALPPAQPFEKGQMIMFHGEPTLIVSPPGRGQPRYEEATETSPAKLIVPAPEGALDGRLRRFIIKQAREAVTQCTTYHAQQLGVSVSKISVRDTSSRWGSCAPGGVISYSWRLICAPPFVLDYVCAHEVAHIIEANHSRDFWDLVDGLVDTVKPAKKWLRDNGARLHAVGAAF